VASLPKVLPRPSIYPSPEHTFACYPSQWLTDDVQIAAAPGGVERLERVLSLPLTNYGGGCRVCDATALQEVIASLQHPRRLGDVKAMLDQPGVEISSQAAGATLAWMLKYGILQASDGGPAQIAKVRSCQQR
jgi:hypothetical protein